MDVFHLHEKYLLFMKTLFLSWNFFIAWKLLSTTEFPARRIFPLHIFPPTGNSFSSKEKCFPVGNGIESIHEKLGKAKSSSLGSQQGALLCISIKLLFQLLSRLAGVAWTLLDQDLFKPLNWMISRIMAKSICQTMAEISLNIKPFNAWMYYWCLFARSAIEANKSFPEKLSTMKPITIVMITHLCISMWSCKESWPCSHKRSWAQYTFKETNECSFKPKNIIFMSA